MKRIKHVSLDEIMSGMSLALDVTDTMGNVLLRKNTLLTDDHIAKLRNKNVKKAPIMMEDNVTPEQEYEQVIRLIEHQFRKTGNDPVMQKLKAMIVEYRTRGLPPRH